MAKTKTRMLVAAAVLCVPLLPCAIFVGYAAIRGGGERPPAEVVPLTGSETDWVVGDKYTVRVDRGGNVKQYEGKLLKAAEDWIVLRDYPTLSYLEGFWLTDGIPVIGDLLTRTHDELCEIEQWIPREAVSIVSHRRGVNMPTTASPVGYRPPINANYYVLDVLSGGLVVQPRIKLKDVDEAELTIWCEEWGGTEKISCDDVFCLLCPYGTCQNPQEAE